MLEYFFVSCESCWEKAIFMLTRALFASIDISAITKIRVGALATPVSSDTRGGRKKPAMTLT